MVWKSKQPKLAPAQPVDELVATMRSEWNFDDTIRGTIKGAPVSFDMSDEFEVPMDWANIQVDVGPSEVGTIRPKKVEIVEPEPEPKPEPEKALSERGIAGRALINDVVMPALAKVSIVMDHLTPDGHETARPPKQFRGVKQAGPGRGISPGHGYSRWHQGVGPPMS